MACSSVITSPSLQRASVEPREITRVASFDALRGVMCIGIAVFHLVPMFFREGDWEFAASRYLAYFTDVFFVMGGFFLGRRVRRMGARREPTREFLVQRLSRLYPLHLATFGFYLLMSSAVWSGFLHSNEPGRYDPWSILPHLTLTHGVGAGQPLAFNYPSWAVSAVFFCDLLVPFLLAAQVRSQWLLGLVLAGSIGTSLIAASLLSVHLTSLQDAGWGALRALPSFVFGLVLATSGLRVRSRLLAAGLLLVALALAFTSPEPLVGLARLGTIYLLVTGVFAAETAGLWIPLSIRPLQALGRYSYGVYLLHMIVATLVVSLLLKRVLQVDAIQLGDSSPGLAYAVLAGSVLASFVAAHVSLHSVERLGGQWIRATLLPSRHSDAVTSDDSQAPDRSRASPLHDRTAPDMTLAHDGCAPRFDSRL